MKLKKGLSQLLENTFRVVTGTCKRFYYDDCFSRASALTYSTLFALIPLTYITIWSFGLFGEGTQGAYDNFQVILSQVLPPLEGEQFTGFKEQIFDGLQGFAANVSQVKHISIAVLLFSIYALINTVESALNVVWRVSSSKSIASRLSDFSTVGLLGPILMALSFFLSAEISNNVPENLQTFYNQYLPLVLPIVVTWFALTLLFYKLPSASVSFRHAAAGGLVSAILFEIAKVGFAVFFEHATTYSKVYGVIASIPVFLVWLYVLWAVVLFGAELAYTLSNLRFVNSMSRYSTELGTLGGMIALKLLAYIAGKYENGEPLPDDGELAAYVGAEPPIIRSVLECLTQAGILTSDDEQTHTRALKKSPENITVGEVYKAFIRGKYENPVFLDTWRQKTSKISEDTLTSEITLHSLVK